MGPKTSNNKNVSSLFLFLVHDVSLPVCDCQFQSNGGAPLSYKALTDLIRPSEKAETKNDKNLKNCKDKALKEPYTGLKALKKELKGRMRPFGALNRPQNNPKYCLRER